MDTNKLGQEPAFPIDNTANYGNNEPGISKRFYAACAAMQGLLSNSNENMVTLNAEQLVFIAFEHADELLRQKNI